MSTRILRINSEIQKIVSEIISTELRNPLINGLISVSRVDTTNDLSISKIYITIFNADDKEEVFNQIAHSAGFIRKELGHRIDLRKTPYLEFILDESLDYSNQIEEVIQKINEKREKDEV